MKFLIGDIVVVHDECDHTCFARVVSFTKSNAPRLYLLNTKYTNKYMDPATITAYIAPDLDDTENNPLVACRWSSKHQCYNYKGNEVSEYDPEYRYKYTWYG